MPVATETFWVEYEGQRELIRAGRHWVCDGHELMRRYPGKWTDDQAKIKQILRDFGRTRSKPVTRDEASRRTPPAEDKSWRLPPRQRPALDLSDHDVRMAARHEAAHAAAAHLFGWEVTGITLHAEGGGNCAIIDPVDLDPRERAEQFAVISYAARAHTGWRHYDDDRGDRRQIRKAIERITSDPLEGQHLRATLAENAKQLVATGKFR
jgi:hypothetical protein